MTDKFAPRTQPSASNLRQMKLELHRLLDMFGGTEGVALYAGVNESAVKSWIKRGRISATGAHEICRLTFVRCYGFSRYTLRPDVSTWRCDEKGDL